tara:strand:+ start:311 stop:616 length:306 start_codon:yes stop_codon:yes gene_type:complete
MPLETSSFPEEVQVAFFISSMLSERWDGMSGTYLGKDWGECEYLLNLYSIENKRVIIFFMKLYEGLLVMHRAEEADRKRKADERKAKSAGGGKNYTHNVQG